MLYLINIFININKGGRFVTLNKYILMRQVYDNNNKCMKKIIVDIHSAYMEISSKIANLDIYKHLHSKI